MYGETVKHTHEILYLGIFWNFVEKIQFSLKSDNNNGTVFEDSCISVIISLWILLRMRNVSENIVEKIKTHIVCTVTFFPPKAVPFVR